MSRWSASRSGTGPTRPGCRRSRPHAASATRTTSHTNRVQSLPGATALRRAQPECGASRVAGSPRKREGHVASRRSGRADGRHGDDATSTRTRRERSCGTGWGEAPAADKFAGQRTCSGWPRRFRLMPTHRRTRRRSSSICAWLLRPIKFRDGRQNLAPPESRKSVAQSHPGHHVHQRRRGSSTRQHRASPDHGVTQIPA